MGVVIFILFVFFLLSFFKSDDSKSKPKSNSQNRNPNNNNQNSNNTSTAQTRSIQMSSTNNTQQSSPQPITFPEFGTSDANILMETYLSKIRFEPDSTQFKDGFNTGQYTYYYLYDYFPVSRFSYDSLTQAQLSQRSLLFDFKDGKNPDYFAKKCASAFVNRFGNEFLKNKIILIIPASTNLKTKNRFEIFLENFCKYTGSTNGYNFLRNSAVERNAQHTGGATISEENLIFNGNFAGKDFIVIDDVRTQGRSSNLVFNQLKRRNANSVIFCYIGRTVPLQNQVVL
jgi:hypothetical protein